MPIPPCVSATMTPTWTKRRLLAPIAVDCIAGIFIAEAMLILPLDANHLTETCALVIVFDILTLVLTAVVMVWPSFLNQDPLMAITACMCMSSVLGICQLILLAAMATTAGYQGTVIFYQQLVASVLTLVLTLVLMGIRLDMEWAIRRRLAAIQILLTVRDRTVVSSTQTEPSQENASSVPSQSQPHSPSVVLPGCVHTV